MSLIRISSNRVINLANVASIAKHSTNTSIYMVIDRSEIRIEGSDEKRLWAYINSRATVPDGKEEVWTEQRIDGKLIATPQGQPEQMSIGIAQVFVDWADHRVPCRYQSQYDENCDCGYVRKWEQAQSVLKKLNE